MRTQCVRIWVKEKALKKNLTQTTFLFKQPWWFQLQVWIAKKLVKILAKDVEGSESPEHALQICEFAIRNTVGRDLCSSMLDEIVIASPLCGNLVVKHLERRRLYHLIRILRDRALVLYPRSLRDNRTNLRHDILRLAFQDLTILLGYRIYLTTDINKSLCRCHGDRQWTREIYKEEHNISKLSQNRTWNWHLLTLIVLYI